jgi:hypothetical protein
MHGAPGTENVEAETRVADIVVAVEFSYNEPSDTGKYK